MQVFKMILSTPRGNNYPVFYQTLEMAKEAAREEIQKNNWKALGDWSNIISHILYSNCYLNVEAPFGDEQYLIEIIDVVSKKTFGEEIVGKRIKTFFSGEKDGMSTILEVKPYTGPLKFIDCILVLTSMGKKGKTEMSAKMDDIIWEIERNNNDKTK